MNTPFEYVGQGYTDRSYKNDVIVYGQVRNKLYIGGLPIAIYNLNLQLFRIIRCPIMQMTKFDVGIKRYVLRIVDDIVDSESENTRNTVYSLYFLRLYTGARAGEIKLK